MKITISDDKIPYDETNMESAEEKRAVTVPSKPLTAKVWNKYYNNELMVFKDGEAIYSNQRKITKPKRSMMKNLKRVNMGFQNMNMGNMGFAADMICH
ncbi:hypothetical protein [uncultured Methanobacterium sp.]|uniref:hypothetical protein n=1 Tax=uncultured Methanobacterium sp. TaxID=176306 RepID=UPI002AA7021D|nr:hypothetical protein [uncultured Methanobacterium sp.]